MARILPFKKIKDSFEDVARAWAPGSDTSSGSEHSVEDSDSAELFDLVNFFIEKDEEIDEKERKIETEVNSSDSEDELFESRTRDMLQNLLGVNNKDEDHHVKEMIRNKTQLACQAIGSSSSYDGFKCQLMSRLRHSGLDAGLCKSRWKKVGNFPAGDYDYIDIIVAKTRYIIEISLSNQFTLARATNHYQSLIDIFPQIFVGKVDELKQVARLMCNAGRKCMKSRNMEVPPWRRNGFMLAKWFGSYKRTTKDVATRHASYSGLSRDGKQIVGFEACVDNSKFGYCRDVLDRKVSLRVGNLAQMLNGRNL